MHKLFSNVPEHPDFIMQFHQIMGEQRTRLLKKAEVATPALVKARSVARPVTQAHMLLELWDKGAEGSSRDLDPTPPTASHSPPSSPPTAPHSSPPSPSQQSPPQPNRCRTQRFGRYSLTEGFLGKFGSYLATCAGGSKAPNLVKEIVTDISKFLLGVTIVTPN